MQYLNNINLIIAAHPDDEILGCGCVIQDLASRGEKCYVLILTRGADTRYDKSMESVLMQQAIDANKIIGTTEVFVENLPNQKLDTIPLLDVTQMIEKYLKELNPSRVFTHDSNDLNLDHQIVHRATITAVRPLPDQCVKELYTYWVPSSSDWNSTPDKAKFMPNVFVNGVESIEKKVEALKVYQSECRDWPHPRSEKSIHIHSSFFGLTVGLEHAEPFFLLRSIASFHN